MRAVRMYYYSTTSVTTSRPRASVVKLPTVCTQTRAARTPEAAEAQDTRAVARICLRLLSPRGQCRCRPFVHSPRYAQGMAAPRVTEEEGKGKQKGTEARPEEGEKGAPCPQFERPRAERLANIE